MKLKKLTSIALLVTIMTRQSFAWEFRSNPDRYPSFGLEASEGKLAGIQKDTPSGAPHTDGGFIDGKLDIRLPISDYITVNAFGESTGINNNLQFSEGNRIGIGVRVYVQ